MSWPDPVPIHMRRERHFGDRLVNCFADRPLHLDAIFREAVAASPGADAQVLRGRLKDMINRAGYKVYSVEVENVLMAHPDVVEAAVVGQPDPVLGERVHAVVASRPGASAAALPGLLRAFCAERLSDYKVPETFTIVSGPLPRNANGKLLKAELRARLPDPAEPRAAPDRSG